MCSLEITCLKFVTIFLNWSDFFCFLKILYVFPRKRTKSKSQIMVLEKDVVGLRTDPYQPRGSAGPGHVTQKLISLCVMGGNFNT